MQIFLEIKENEIQNLNLPDGAKIIESIFSDNAQMITYSFSFEPTYLLLSNSFSFERNIEETFEGKIAYSKYLSQNEIKSLSYFDYSGEKIHRLIVFEGGDLEKIRPADLLVVTSKLIHYLEQNKLEYKNEETINELQVLNTLSTIFNKKEYSFLVFAG